MDALPSPDRPVTGGCLCGAVRYVVSGPFLRAGHCHCSRCRKHSGAAAGIQGRVRREDFRLVSGAERLVVYRPAPPAAVKVFCEVCGSSLFGGTWPDGPEISIRLGTVDGDPGIRPQYHTFVASKAAWHTITDDLPPVPRGASGLTALRPKPGTAVSRRSGMARISALLAAVTATILLAARPSAAQEAAPLLVMEPFRLRGFDAVETAAELGRLTVPADRGNPASGTIELAFVRLASTSDRPGSPIVFLAGGPGVPGIVMGQVPVYRSLFERLRSAGDVILLDQRGTGRSTPSLECPADSSLPVDLLLDQARALAALLPPLEKCAARLLAQGIDPADYTTAASADDVDDLRRALGAERVSLLGFSYGTELALAYASRHGGAVDRLVLAAVQPPWSVVKLPSRYDAVIAALSALAARDTAAGIPDFEGSLRRSLQRLDQAPLAVTVTDRRTGAPVELRAGKVALQAILQGGLADGRARPGQVAMVAALDRGEPELFRREVDKLYNGLGGGIGMMGVAMNCSAGWSPERRARAHAEGETALLGDVMNLMLAPAACAIVGNPDLGPDYRALVASDAPTLFLSGSLDPNTPPAEAEEALAGFPHGVHVVIENGSHETLPAEEVQALVADFLAGADVSGRAVTFPPPRFPTAAQALAGPPGP